MADLKESKAKCPECVGRSPMPWRLDHTEVVDATGAIVAKITYDDGEIVDWPKLPAEMDEDDREVETRAYFLVHAANSHEGLVKRLEEAASAIETVPTPGWAELKQLIGLSGRIKTTLALAKGQTSARYVQPSLRGVNYGLDK